MPAVPEIPRLVNVATPLEEVAVAVPTVLPPELTDAVTTAEEVVTTFPAESSTRTTGCVVNAAPEAVPCAGVVSDKDAAAPVVTTTVCESLVSRVPLVNVAA